MKPEDQAGLNFIVQAELVADDLKIERFRLRAKIANEEFGESTEKVRIAQARRGG